MSAFQKIPCLVRTVPRLGLANVARVAAYRARLATGWRPMPIDQPCPEGAFFGPSQRDIDLEPVDELLFGWKPLCIEGAPSWHANPFNPNDRLDPAKAWHTALGDLQGADPKHYWELSRFYWVPRFALAAREGDAQALARLNAWLSDWVDTNPPNTGINWSCGQEASIRVMNLALAALILDSPYQPNAPLTWMIEAHAMRIAPTLQYAIGQDNNHASAEACALFIAGHWGQSWDMPNATKYAHTGRRWLANRAIRLIGPDGSPSQYSVTYHRANLEVFSLAQLWAEKTGAPGLSDATRARVALGARWMHRMTDPETGDAPNIGANDGSHLFNLHGVKYRDFRPAIEFAARIFDHSSAWPDFVDPRVSLLGLPDVTESEWPAPESSSDDHGGFQVLRVGRAMAVLRYPRFHFRPSQADALHVDLWHNGINLLRDAGTYSYSAVGAGWFAGTAAHNTIEFDGRDQMPRLGRFLFGDWLKAEAVEPVLDDGVKASAAAEYTDAGSARHHRAVTLSAGAMTCMDTISGNFEKACLRWRLAPGDWHIEGNIVRNGTYSIAIEFDGVPVSPSLSSTVESRCYQQKTEILEVSIKVSRPGKLITKVIF